MARDKKFTRRILYTICFILLCIIDQRKGSVTGSWQMILPNFISFCLALLVLPSCKLKDFKAPVYLIWCLTCIVAIPTLTIFFHDAILSQFYPLQWVTGVLSVALWGTLFIYAILHTKWKFFFLTYRFQLIFSLVLLLFGFSINDSIWPWQYLLMYGTLALVTIPADDKKLIILSLADGIIFSFFMLQGFAFLFRPYDEIRYLGMYSNTNINALFYQMVYCSFLAKYLHAQNAISERYKLFHSALLLFFCGSMWSFVLLTVSRSAMFSMILSTMVAGIYYLSKQPAKQILSKGSRLIISLLLYIILSFPLTYGAARYLPTILHHPVWFHAEYTEEKVHSFDPWDSPKYTSWRDVLDLNFHRIVELFSQSPENDISRLPNSFYQFNINRSLLVTNELTAAMLSEVMYLPPVLEYYTGDSSIIRSTIYNQYLSKLNTLGHRNIENGVQVTPSYYAPHAHNLYLQFAFNFGIPAGILFILATLSTLCGYVEQGMCKNNSEDNRLIFITCAIFYISCLAFGMVEIMWLNGELPFTLLFLLPSLIPPFPREDKRLQSQESQQE
ncbi:MAG: hypothetical protein K6G30_09325 [Acetatifactor sp.]|nr:hypothetical protein [Acetatifactor sp.]